MAAVESNMIALGSSAADFSLTDTVSGKILGLKDVKGEKATVIAFICNHCPYVKLIIEKFSEMASEYQSRGIGFAAISSNDIKKYPDDSPEKMKEFALEHSFGFPYLFDESQDIARSYRAACTPDLFVFDSSLSLVYRGQFDSSRPGNNQAPDGRDLKEALEDILSGREVSSRQIPSIGCSIKWKD